LNVLSTGTPPNDFFKVQDLVDRIPDSPSKVNQYLKFLLQNNLVERNISAGGSKQYRITKEGRKVQVHFNHKGIRQLLGVDKPQFIPFDKSESLERHIRAFTLDFT
jgi:CTP-dependent riboflavin kinase